MGEFWIGIDGTDSPYGGCTTWTLSNMIDLLCQKDSRIIFHEYPRLIRLNPNIPQKTRGNGALSLHVTTSLPVDQLAQELRTQIIKDQQQYQLTEAKKPALVIFDRQPPDDLYWNALVYYLDWSTVLQAYRPLYSWPEPNQSYIGAIAAIVADLTTDCTFELLAYRFIKDTTTERVIDSRRVKAMHHKYPSLFSSYDLEQDRELIAPSGPDPIFCGIRGENPEILPETLESLAIDEQLASFTIFRTNQATDAHEQAYHKLKMGRKEDGVFGDYQVFSGVVELIESPCEITGGHVFCLARFEDQIVRLSWFEPTKQLRDQARLLAPGDRIQITSALRYKEDMISLQIEFMMIVDSPNRQQSQPPLCGCGVRMTSAGSFSGYKCKACGQRSRYAEITRNPSPFFSGQMVFASPTAQRHLTRPKSRMHKRTRTYLSEVPLHKFRKLFND